MIPTRWLFKAAEAGLYFTSNSLDDTLPDGCLKLAKLAFILPQRRLIENVKSKHWQIYYAVLNYKDEAMFILYLVHEEFFSRSHRTPNVE